MLGYNIIEDISLYLRVVESTKTFVAFSEIPMFKLMVKDDCFCLKCT